jgi:ArsR family transcriptional regulator
MALEVGAPPQRSQRIRLLVSELHELNFALFLDRCGELKPDHKPVDWLGDFRRDHPELYERIATFWDSPDYHAFDEMLVYAWHTGTFLDETIDAFFERLPGAMRQKIEVPPLPSERPDVPGIVAERLEMLRTSAELRQRYLAMLTDTWAVLGPLWRKRGRPAVLDAIRGLRDIPANLEGLRRLFPGVTMLRKEQYEPLLQNALDRDQVVIVPLWLAGDGQFLFALPGVLQIGFGLESGRRVEIKREQAERVASRLKVLSDPTRVGMLRQAMHDAATITDLANYFELSQPTVSVHMKALREAGLVDAEKSGNQTRYRARPERIWEYVADALAEIGVSGEV